MTSNTNLEDYQPITLAQLPAVLREQADNAWQGISPSHQDRLFGVKEEVQLLFALSPFVTNAVLNQPEILVFNDQRVALDTPENYANQVQVALNGCADEVAAQRQLRRLRERLMAKLAMADIRGELTLEQTLKHLSVLADSFLEVSLAWLTTRFVERYGEPQDEHGVRQSLVVIAMGKLGGGELNFSSDIDLIFAYPEQGQTVGASRSLENQVFFTRLAQALVQLLDTQTAEGQVYRIDLRLRPFGQSGPLVASFTALENYYQEQGRDWERYAMVKARLLGVEPELQLHFERMLRPFVYRRYIDFSVIEALRKMKMLIAQESRRRGMSDNIKLGPGGIRELEFIVQSFQLIRGGQERRLQTRSWHSALNELGLLQLIDGKTSERLIQSYEFLRVVEHRLQQIRDEQTQKLPSDPIEQQRLAAMLGFADWRMLVATIIEHTNYVAGIFESVIGRDDIDASDDSPIQLLWQDLLDDATALDLLDEHVTTELIDERQAVLKSVWQQVQHLRQYFRSHTSGPRGRRAIARLFPKLLQPLLQESTVVSDFERLSKILQRVASRTAYVELLLENPGAREQLIRLCRASEWVAQQVATYPLLLDELIDPQQLQELPQEQDYLALVGDYLLRIPEQDLEQQMDALRQARQAMQLKIAAADITRNLSLARVSDHLTYLAEAVLTHVVQLAWQQLASRHGTPPGTSIEHTHFAVMGYGKFGGWELGYGSDLDLVFITDADYQGQTDGERPLETQQFYLRLAQRILHLATTRTLTGVLYDIDMRLRPAGKAGLLVTRLNSYDEYLNADAWTWEHQALVRARPVYGHSELRTQLAQLRVRQIRKGRDTQTLRQTVVDMRERMRERKQSNFGFDLKQSRGGMVDIEFIVQYLVLAHGNQFSSIAQHTDNARVLEEAASLDLLPSCDADALIASYRFLREEQHKLALAKQAEIVTETHPAWSDIQESARFVADWWRRTFELQVG